MSEGTLECGAASVVISSETYYTIGLWLSDSNFFLLSNYRNIEYRIGELKKPSDYRISDQGLNLSDYRITDSEKTIGCPPLLIGHIIHNREKYTIFSRIFSDAY
jgi:hypothetical protein